MKIRIKRIDKSLPLPEFNEASPITLTKYPKEQVAGFDLYCREATTVQPHSLALLPINNVIAVPPDHFLLICARSSMPWKKGLMLANSVGISDPFYSGDDDELKLQVLNFTDKAVTIEKGEALAQGLILKREPVEWNEVTAMGKPGHGGYNTDTTVKKEGL